MTKCYLCSSLPRSEYLEFLPTTIHKMKEFDETKIFICSKCNFGYVETDFNSSRLNDYYQIFYSGLADKSEKYNFANLRSEYEYNTRIASQMAILNSFIDKSRPIKLLEIGPGKGDFLYAISQKKWNAESFVFEPQIKAQEILKNIDVKVIPESFNQNIIKDYLNFFDIVYMSHSLEHFKPSEIKDTIKLIHQALKPSGIFFCEVPNADLIQTPFEAIVPHLSFFSINSMKEALPSNLFNIKFIKSCGEKYSNKITHDMQIEELDKKGFFNFKKSEDGNYLLNLKLLQKKKTNRLKKLAYSLLKILPIKYQIKLKNLRHRIFNKSIYKILSSEDFSYGENREFIRVIAEKIN